MSDQPKVLESTGGLMDWCLFAPVEAECVPTFSFEFRKDCDCGSLDHLHVEPEDVGPLIRFLGGVSVSDLQRAIVDVRSRHGMDPAAMSVLGELVECLDLAGGES